MREKRRKPEEESQGKKIREHSGQAHEQTPRETQ